MLAVDEEMQVASTLEANRPSMETEDLIQTLSTTERPLPISSKPALLQRRLTENSERYDRDGKGYLDETERALRRLDSQSKGHLDIGKVYLIMKSLQDEQKKSAALNEEILEHHKNAATLKKVIIGLCGFAVLLAMANIGTSFAAAWLAKETQVVASNDLVSLNNAERVATTTKLISISMDPVEIFEDITGARRLSMGDGELRRLEDVTSLACGDEIAVDENTTSFACELQGRITYENAVKLYEKFCPGWPESNDCGDGGVVEVMLNCNQVRSSIFGGSLLPPGNPTPDVTYGPFSKNFTVFPTHRRGYVARQTLYRNYNETLGFGAPDPSCQQDFSLGIYCRTSGEPCLVFSGYIPECYDWDDTLMHVQVCGEAVTSPN